MWHNDTEDNNTFNDDTQQNNAPHNDTQCNNIQHTKILYKDSHHISRLPFKFDVHPQGKQT